MGIEEYQDLANANYEPPREQTKPEDEFFHSLYISGQSRKNHINIVEQAGKIQVRGVEYNLDVIYGIIIHIKTILVKSVQKNGKESTECFSWCDGQPPWKSTSGNLCGKNSAERSSIAFCTPCRSQIIVTFMRTDPSGKLITTPDNKTIFFFIRAKGAKYSNMQSYLTELAKLDMEPVFTPVTPETTKFEKANVNNKRWITCIKTGYAQTKYGSKSVFEFSRSAEIPKGNVHSLLDAAKKTLGKFQEKFNWANYKNVAESGYGNGNLASGENKITDFGDIGDNLTNQSTPSAQQNKSQEQTYSFDDISF